MSAFPETNYAIRKFYDSRTCKALQALLNQTSLPPRTRIQTKDGKVRIVKSDEGPSEQLNRWHFEGQPQAVDISEIEVVYAVLHVGDQRLHGVKVGSGRIAPDEMPEPFTEDDIDRIEKIALPLIPRSVKRKEKEGGTAATKKTVVKAPAPVAARASDSAGESTNAAVKKITTTKRTASVPPAVTVAAAAAPVQTEIASVSNAGVVNSPRLSKLLGLPAAQKAQIFDRLIRSFAGHVPALTEAYFSRDPATRNDLNGYFEVAIAVDHNFEEASRGVRVGPNGELPAIKGIAVEPVAMLVRLKNQQQFQVVPFDGDSKLVSALAMHVPVSQS